MPVCSDWAVTAAPPLKKLSTIGADLLYRAEHSALLPMPERFSGGFFPSEIVLIRYRYPNGRTRVVSPHVTQYSLLECRRPGSHGPAVVRTKFGATSAPALRPVPA